MKYTYKSLHKTLSRDKRTDGCSCIDELVCKYGKFETIQAIEYMADFIGSSTYNDMEYWHDGEDTPGYLATKDIARELLKLIDRDREKLEYYIAR